MGFGNYRFQDFGEPTSRAEEEGIKLFFIDFSRWGDLGGCVRVEFCSVLKGDAEIGFEDAFCTEVAGGGFKERYFIGFQVETAEPARYFYCVEFFIGDFVFGEAFPAFF